MSKALKSAIESNDAEAARVAIARVKDLSRKLAGASTPLLYACEVGADKVLTVLLDAGVPVKGRDDYEGNHPFVVAQQHGRIPAMRVLLERKLVPGDALDHALKGAARSGQDEVLRFILDTARPAVTPQLFRFASFAKKPELFRILVAAGGNPNDRDKSGQTPLHDVVQTLNGGMVRMLIELGANVNATDGRGRTPLMMLGHSLERIGPNDSGAAVAMIKLLVELGANASQVDYDGNDAIDHYRFELLRARSAPIEPMLDAFKKAGASGSDATFELFVGLRERNLGKIQDAIEHGADVNRIPPPHWNSTPLMAADDVETLDLLLHAGADPNKPANNYLPLIPAAGRGNLKVVKRLLEAGADLHAIQPLPADSGMVPDNALTAAERGGQKEMVSFLKSLGATKPVLQWKPFEPGVESWNDFSEFLVRTDPATAAAAIATIIDGRTLPDVYRKTAEIGRLAYVVIRPKGMNWSNVYRLAPQRLRSDAAGPTRNLAAALAAEAKCDVLIIEYSDTTEAVPMERFSASGAIDHDGGSDYDTLNEIVDAMGNEAPKWAKDKLKQTSPDDPSSMERLKSLAAAERFVVGAFSFGHERESTIEVDVHGYPAAAFDPVFVVTV